jgi:hypothetical protein
VWQHRQANRHPDRPRSRLAGDRVLLEDRARLRTQRPELCPIAQRHIRADGRFTFRWIPKNKNIGKGDWRLVARMRCESGKDGSRFFVRASTRITIN